MKSFQKEIFIALSGGVDSAVTAALLLEAGWKVRGVHLLLADGQAEQPALGPLCRFLGIKWRQVDLRREFLDQVIRYFLELYRQGRTPNPCVRCNERVKFGALLRLVRSWGGSFLATGHYARLEATPGGSRALYRGVDPLKEQSYFLHRLDRNSLDAIVFPLGSWTKAQVREKSDSLGLTPYLPPRESQELCFIPGKYTDFLQRLGGQGLNRPGPIVSLTGKILGTHRGLEHYTVGQRQGLGVPGPAPYYVVEIIPQLNQIVVGGKEDIRHAAAAIEQINWLIPPPGAPLRAEVRLRYRHPGAGCVITPGRADSAQVVFDRPQSAVTPGQAAVFYLDDRVLGGGWIARGFDP